jgi:hypothetical protein
VGAPPGGAGAWVHACRPGDVPYWLDDELWRVELDDPVEETRYQVRSPRGRLVSRVPGWNAELGLEYARACALHARDVALPHLEPGLRGELEGENDLEAIVAAVKRSGATSFAAGWLSDAANAALHVGPAPASYVAGVLAASLGGGLAAFEAERAWQARWLAARLALESA